MSKKKVLFVEWEDITSTNKWHTFENATENLIRCRSVGVLIHEDKNTLVITQSYANNKDLANSLGIPKSVIKKRKVIGYVE